MGSARRATVYFEPRVSEIVNGAVKLALAEAVDDLEAFEKRKREPNVDFKKFVGALKRRGKS